MRKRWIALVTAVLLLCTVGAAASAQETVDLSKKGSISVTMQEGKTTVSGGTLTLYRVGTIQTDNSGYQLTSDFTGSNISLTKPSADTAKKLAQYASGKKLSGTTKDIDKKGIVTFSDLQTGLYLLVQNKAADGYYAVDPFLVSVPMLEKGKYIYDVDASPKVELKPTPSKPNSSTPSTNTPSTSTKTPSKTSTLPKTGQLDWPVPVLVVTGLCLFSVGWMLRYGGKKGRYEK